MPPDLSVLRRDLEQRSTDELLELLHEHDEEEWRPEVFDLASSILATRGLPADDLKPFQTPAEPEPSEAEPPVTLATFFSPAEAHACRMALEEAALPAWVLDEAGGTMYGVGVGTRVAVRAEDAAAARDLLESPPVPGNEMPAELAEPPCPNCGSRRVSQEAVVEDDPSGMPILQRSGRRWRYLCLDCDEVWPA